MKNEWRVPTIMDLSSLFRVDTFSSYEHIWTCTPFVFKSDIVEPHYWTGVNPPDKIPIYEAVAHSQHLVCMLVKSNGPYLNWTNPRFNYVFPQAQDLCARLNSYDKITIRYNSERLIYEH